MAEGKSIMQLLYEKASVASSTTPNNQKVMLASHIDELYNMFIEACDENIMNAANRGSHHAVLAIYKINAKHRNIIPVRDLINPPASLSTKLSTLSLQSLMHVLADKLKPFTVSVVPVTDLLDIESKSYVDIEALVVKWT